MKTILVLLALFVVFAALPSFAETVTFTKPTTYEDSTAIAPAESALLQCQFDYRVLPSTTWSIFGTSASGASTLTGAYVTPVGSSSSWRGRCRVGSSGTFGGNSGEYAFSRPFPAPSAPTGATIQ